MNRKLGDKVILPKGTQVGMAKLRYSTEATIIGIETREDGSKFFRVQWIDIKGYTKTTYVD